MAKISKNSIKAWLDLIIGKAYDSVASYLKRFSARLIILSLLIMHRPINLQNQALLGAAKIDYEATDWVLTPKLEATALAITQVTPQHCLGRRSFPTQLLRVSADLLGCAGAAWITRRYSSNTIASRLPAPAATGAEVRAFP